MSEQPRIVVNDLVVRYGDAIALDRVSLQVSAGAICGVSGPNGAGKTTLLRVLATLLRPSEGSALVNGFDVAREGDAVRRSIGVALVNDRGMYWRMSGTHNLRFFARALGMRRAHAARRADEVAALMGLDHLAHRRVAQYSAGERQRLVLARATLANPDVLLVDEPLRGLDEDGISRVRALMESYRARGASVLVVGPSLTDLADLCESITVLRKGSVIVRSDKTPKLQPAGESR